MLDGSLTGRCRVMPALLPDSSLLVLGIGNTLLSDDGFGVHALQALRRRLAEEPDDIEMLDGGTLGLALAPMIAQHEALIVLDAARFDAVPGEVAAFCGEEMDRFLAANRKRSAHEVGLLDLTASLQLEEVLPPRRALIVVQPGWMDWGDKLSDAVAASVGAACRLAETLIAAWRAGLGWGDIAARGVCWDAGSALPSARGLEAFGAAVRPLGQRP
ncbi:MAG: HyaD/HybD family hydrogenase maturation endopeptidase [Rhodocyclaceae bacterium]